MSDRVELLVIGAGPCGLGAGLGLMASVPSDAWQLVEASPVAGGLAGSATDASGFTWDYGGHVTFSRDRSFVNAMDLLLGEDGWNRLDRRAWAIVEGQWIQYPVQHHWPQRGAIGDTCRHVSPIQTGGNLEDWALGEFGDELVEAFFRPYNEKLWSVPMREIGTQWMEDRVALSARAPTRPWGGNSQFAYPAHGGAGAPWRRLAARLSDAGGRLRYGQTVISVDLARKIARLSDRSEIHFGSLISTMPIDRLVELTEVPAELRGQVHRLKRNRVTVVGVGMQGAPPEDLPEFTWIYAADPELPFYRVSQLSAYSAANTPGASHWSLLVECSAAESGDASPTDSDVLDGLRRVRLLAEDHLCRSIWRAELEYGYPVPTLDRDDLIDPVLAFLEDRGCFSRGRFGDWAYETSGQDQAFQKGLETVSQISGIQVPPASDAMRHLLTQ